MIDRIETCLIKRKFSGKSALCCICFALCFFLFQLVEFSVNDRAEIIFGSDLVTLVYAVGIFFSAVGFCAFSFFYKRLKTTKKIKVFLYAIGFLLIVASLLLSITPLKILFLLSSYFALFLCGVLNSVFYFCLAQQFSGSAYIGRIIGISMGVMVLLQYAVQNIFVASYWMVFIACVTVCTLVILIFLSKHSFDLPLPCSPTKKANAPNLLTLVVATAVMTAIVVLSDGVCVEKHAEGVLSVSAVARLFYAFSLMVAGFVADIKNRKYFSLTTICVLFVSAISTALISPPTYFVAVSMLYVYCGFYVVFLTINFIEIAPQQKDPWLWAGMGRIVRSLVTSLTIMPALWLYNQFGNILLIASSILLSIITLLLLLKDINNALFAVAPAKAETVNLDTFKEEYSLTEKEFEVLKRLLLTEENIQKIAEGMFISRRVLQRHISSIYQKTGTSTRAGLIRKLMASNVDVK